MTSPAPLARRAHIGPVERSSGLVNAGLEVQFRRISRAAAIAVVLIGLLVLAGRLWGLDSLKAVLLGPMSMKANTALALVLAGTALELLAAAGAGGRQQLLGRLGATAAGLLALLTLSQDLFHWDLGIDQWLFREPSTALLTVAPGRMDPNTVFNFLLLSAALVLQGTHHRVAPILAQLLALGSGLISLLALIGYFYHITSLYSLGRDSQMAPPTAIAFLVLAIGTFFARPDRALMATLSSQGPGGVLLRRLGPAVILIPVALGWLIYLGYQAHFYLIALGLPLLVVSSTIILGALTWVSARAADQIYVQRQQQALDALRHEATERRHAEEALWASEALYRAEEALRSSEARYRTIVDTSQDAIALTDLHGTILFCNQSTAALLGTTRIADLVGTNIFALLAPEDRPRAFRRARAVRDGQPIANVEYQVLRRDGSRCPVELSATHVLDGRGRPGGFVVCCRDLTERRRAEAARRAQEAADAGNAAKSEFLSRMSHELRTPLNAILGFAQILELEGPSPDQHESLDQILRAGRHLLQLINEVLEISRIEAGGLAISPEPVLLADIVQSCLALVQPLAAARGLTLATEALVAPEAYVQADLQRLTQVVLNLLSNAIKYNRAGGCVTVRTEQVRPDGIRLAVRDTGLGIAPEALGRLFVPFERLDALQSNVEGTGLGLVLARRLMEAMGGQLGVTSTLGIGSTFWIELRPAADPAAPAPAPAAPAPATGDQGGTVLYIEDNLSNLRLVEQVLGRQAGIRLITSQQGRLGLELAQAHHPDLILLDLHLPDMTGEEVLQQLQAEPATRAIPVVVISAGATAGQIARLLAAGAAAYLPKPFVVPELLQRLDQFLGAPAGAAPDPQPAAGLAAADRGSGEAGI
ncbi:MAG TPA: ATP-binding protein [Chloroflexia bacterium]|nr:ATP-binding protein [Chloroflexia bacterium]